MLLSAAYGHHGFAHAMQLLKITGIVLLGTMLSACSSITGIRTGNEALFATLQTQGEFQVRLYEPQIIAQTAAGGAYGRATMEGYRRLTTYVSGGNQVGRIIGTTAIPRISNSNKPAIEPTLPYYQELVNGMWVTSVSMPEAYTLATLPKPADERITFETLPRVMVAVISYVGYPSKWQINSKANKLAGWLRSQNYAAASPPRAVIYDSPWTLPTLRRHEIHISIR